MSDLKIDSIKTTDHKLNPYIDIYDTGKIRIKLNGGCLKRFPPTILHGGIVNIYIAYEAVIRHYKIVYLDLLN